MAQDVLPTVKEVELKRKVQKSFSAISNIQESVELRNLSDYEKLQRISRIINEYFDNKICVAYPY